LVPTAVILFNAIIGQNVILFLGFILINIALAFISVFVLTKSYKKVNQQLNNYATETNNRPLTYNKNSNLKSLLKMEFKQYFNIPIYVVNSFFGMILIFVASVVAVILGFINIEIIKLFDNIIIIGAIIAIFAFCSVMSNTTSSSISIEGNKINIKKSLPINFNEIAMSKILLNILLVCPILIFCFLILLPLLVVLKISLLGMLFILILPILLNITFSVIGFMVNLWHPKLNWNNEVAVVKQSLSVFITLMSGMFAVYGLVGLFFAVNKFLSLYLYLTIITLIIIAILALFVWLINTKGKKLYFYNIY
jgi:ABC-2 type transport system permease protein